jgi:hypothetical protein
MMGALGSVGEILGQHWGHQDFKKIKNYLLIYFQTLTRQYKYTRGG